MSPAKYNPRKDLKPADQEYQHIRNSLDRFGYIDPIIWNRHTGNIVGGHQRFKILVAGGATEIECIVVDFDELTEKAANAALNQAQGDWDRAKLDELLKDLATQEFDMTPFGFEMPIAVTDDDFDVDAEAEAIIDPVTQPGDIWTLGPHRLTCGDSLNHETVALLMAGRKADMIFTDPPYNVAYGTNKLNVRWKARQIENDNQTPAEWQDFCRRLTERIRENTIGDIYVWGASGPDGMRQRLALIDGGIHWSATIIWKKNQLVLSPAKYQRIYEPCFYGWIEGGRSSFVGGRSQVELWEFDRPRDSKLHPTMKPVALCAHALDNSSRQGGLVLDLFGGSGSTLIAAEQTKRTCYMAELDPRYCDVIVKRWEQESGKKAERA